jgi:ribonuclease Z
MPSHNLAYIKLGDIEITGYSVAGEETVVAVPELDVCFDIGKAPDQFIPINHVLLSHGHMDHAAGIAYYLSHRKFCGQSPGTVLAPENCIENIQTILQAWGRLDGSRIPAKLIGVKPGSEHKIKPNLLTRVFPTRHSRGSVGFSVIEIRKKLKPEYLGLSGEELVNLKKNKVTIDYTLELPLVSYLGDTQYVDFAKLDYVSASKVLIAECTFFDEDHEGKAQAGKHMHVEQLAELLERMENEHIVLVHLTQRTGIGEIKRILREKFSPSVYNKVTILMDRRNRGYKSKATSNPPKS